MATAGRSLAVALAVGLGMMAGADMQPPADDRRFRAPSRTPDRCKCTHMQQRSDVLREKRRAKKKMARKSKQRGR